MATSQDVRKAVVITLGIVEGIVTIPVVFTQPELVPLISGIFRVARGSVDFSGFISQLRSYNTATTLAEIQQAMKDLNEASERNAKGLAQMLRAGGLYETINVFVKTSKSNLTARELEEITSRASGLPFKLNRLHGCITEKGIFPNITESWMTYICDHCQKNSSDNDATWGLAAAAQQFAAVLGLQRMAVAVLQEVATYPVTEYITNIESQVDLFWKEFEERWNRDVGKMKRVRKFPRYGQTCYGDISNGFHYSFVRTIATGRFIASTLTRWNLLNQSKEELFGMHSTMHRSYTNYRIVVHGNYLYTLSGNGLMLHVIDISNPPPKYSDLHNLTCSASFDLKSKMVRAHAGGQVDRLFAVRNDGLIIMYNCEVENSQVDENKEYPEILWVWNQVKESRRTSFALTCIPGKRNIYAVSQKVLYSVFPNCRQLKTGRNFTNMAFVGHGSHLYAIDNRELYAYDTRDGSYNKIDTDYRTHIGRIRSRSINLMQDGMTLYLQVDGHMQINGRRRNTHLYMIKPHWIKPQCAL